jgi:hypothetical protein
LIEIRYLQVDCIYPLTHLSILVVVKVWQARIDIWFIATTLTTRRYTLDPPTLANLYSGRAGQYNGSSATGVLGWLVEVQRNYAEACTA